jgi:predicted RNA binding protein YcfA (HicA-like mRNA interferase family)
MSAAFHKLPALRAREIIRALHHAGFIADRQKGSHVVMKHPEKGLHTVVPDHGGEDISKGLLMAIIEQSGLSVDEFLDLL